MCACTKKTELSEIETLKGKEAVVIGVKVDSKPFGFINKQGENAGFDIDIAKGVMKRLYPYIGEKPIKFVPVTAQDKIMKLNSREIDLIVAAMSINESRKNVVDFSMPYFIAGQAIMVKANSDIKTVRDLNFKDVAVIMGTTSERDLKRFAPNTILKGCANYKEAFSLLQTGEVQAIYADDTILYGLLDNKGYRILNARYTKEYYAIAMRKEKNEKELKQRIDIAIRDMQEKKELAGIRQKWLKDYVNF